MVTIRKRVPMPPVATAVPKKPSFKNPKVRCLPEPLLNCICYGGPWAGERITMFRSRPATAIFSLRGFRGRYVLTADLMNCVVWERLDGEL